MKSLLLLILLSAACARAWDPDSSHVMGGWDGGPSVKFRIFKAYWLGINGTNYENQDEYTYDDKIRAADSSTQTSSSFTKTDTRGVHANLVLERENRVQNYLFLNVFASVGYGYSKTKSDWRNYENPPWDRESNDLSASVGVMPTVRVLERVRISLRFAVQATRTWGKDSWDYVYPGDPQTYHRRDTFESTDYTYTGRTSLFNTEFGLHWLF